MYLQSCVMNVLTELCHECAYRVVMNVLTELS